MINKLELIFLYITFLFILPTRNPNSKYVSQTSLHINCVSNYSLLFLFDNKKVLYIYIYFCIYFTRNRLNVSYLSYNRIFNELVEKLFTKTYNITTNKTNLFYVEFLENEKWRQRVFRLAKVIFSIEIIERIA